MEMLATETMIGPDYRIAFDPQAYLAANPDVAASGMDPFVHWIAYGREEERRGERRNALAPHFDSEYYLAAYPDVAGYVHNGHFVSAAEHWKLAGQVEVSRGYRAIAPGFDADAYLAARPDVAASLGHHDRLAAYDHWLSWGRHELGYDRPSSSSIISSEKAEFWSRRGYLILEGLFTPDRCEAVNARLGELWAERASGQPPVSVDIYIDREGARRVPFAEAPGAARALPYKLNDMVMHDVLIGSVALDERLCEALAWVLGDRPVAIGSLNFERSSTQEFHTDTLYMPGETAGGMTAAWIALEDVSPDAGPLLYYPGSHEIPLFLFSDGRPNQRLEEFHLYREHMHGHVASMELVPETFLPRQGDVLIWHERLFHAGGAIKDISLTRKSLVVHYWRLADMQDKQLEQRNGGYYWNRPPLT